jgi:nitrite reductase/ring-hydroxylating ferredoxin subunit
MRLVALTGDPLLLRNVGRLATMTGLEMVQTVSLDTVADIDPTAIVIDLDEHGPEAVATSKERWPSAMVVGVLTMPGGTAWQRAELAGSDVVTTRGAITKTVPPRLAAWLEQPGGRRLRLFSLNDVAGRLGVVARLEDPTIGPVAAFQVGGKICVVRDVCPHAGATLSAGEVDVDTGVVTCPEHGSRFDICSGERLRGPADVSRGRRRRTGLHRSRSMIAATLCRWVAGSPRDPRTRRSRPANGTAPSSECSAATYSPGTLRSKYHRRWRA